MPTKISSLFNGGIDSGMTGSGKRSYYAMLSYNTSSTWYGAAWFNQNFGPAINVGRQDTFTNWGPMNISYSGDSTYQFGSGLYQGAGASQSSQSSSSTRYTQGTNMCGEFGNATIDAYSDGTLNPVTSRYGSSSVKDYLNAHAINSDHSNRRIVYLLISGKVRAVDRLYGTYQYPMGNTADYTVSSLNSSMQGSASYNRSRQELTILSYSSSNGSYNVYTFANVDFDLYPNPNVALNRPEVVRTNSTVSMSSNWNSNDDESYYNLKPIVTNNGKVYVSVMFTSNNFTLYEFTRSGTSAVTGTYITQQSLTTSYGRGSGIAFGQRQITSRDGTSVATFCPYYYYGSGIRCYMIDKVNNTYTAYGYADSSYGHQILPWGDSGWVFIYAGNVYSSNYTGGYPNATYVRRSTGGFEQHGTSSQYFQLFTGPNTTNYPGYTQAVDYVLLPFDEFTTQMNT